MTRGQTNTEYTNMELGLLKERNEAEDILAEALGYPYDDEYGWVTGEHTILTLVDEAARKLNLNVEATGYERDELVQLCKGDFAMSDRPYVRHLAGTILHLLGESEFVERVAAQNSSACWQQMPEAAVESKGE